VTLRFRLKDGGVRAPSDVLDEHVDEAANILGNLIY